MSASFSIGGKRALIDHLATRQFKAALFTAKANLGESRDKFSSENELTGPGYDAGGMPLTVSGKGTDGNIAFLSFANPTWSNASFIGARYMEIYDTETLTSYGTFDFGTEKSGQGADFTYKFPRQGGVIRI